MVEMVFSANVRTKLGKKAKKEIRQALIGNKDMAKEIRRVLQQANRRAQNIEKSGVISPAYQGLMLEGRNGYSKFTITGLNIKDEHEWNKAKYEYTRAIEFLNNPTSMSSGAKQYIKHLSKVYNKPIDFVNNVVRQSTSTQIFNGQIPLMNYKSMIDTFLRDSKNAKDTMENNARENEKIMEQNIVDETEKIKSEWEKMGKYIEKDLKNTGFDIY